MCIWALDYYNEKWELYIYNPKGYKNLPVESYVGEQDEFPDLLSAILVHKPF